MALKIGSVLRWNRVSSIYILLDGTNPHYFYVLDDNGSVRGIRSYYFRRHDEM